MKKVLLSLTLLLVFCIKSDAQQQNEGRFYVSTGTGINYSNGILGVQFSKVINKKFMPYMALGLGTWGYKVTPGVRYFFSEDLLGAGLAISYSSCTGVSGVKTELELSDGTKKEIEVDYKSVGTLNFSYVNSWRLGKKSNTMFLEVGYSLALNTDYENNYKIKTPDVVLSSNTKNAFKLVQPGGILVGLGFNFGM